MTTTTSTWTGLVPVDDTALAVTDTGGPGRPVVYLNGQFATQAYWRRVVAELGGAFRHITYDMRARGRSGRSADYSFEANVRDVGAVLAARGVERPLLAGWSYGAPVALHWASRNPERVLGVVCVDGAYPYDFSYAEERIRRLWRRSAWLLPLLARMGMAARMSARQHADSNIELCEIYAALGPVLDSVPFPVRYVAATGGNLGGGRAEMESMRDSLAPVLARNPNIKVSAKVASNHGTILRKDFRAVADAVRELAAAAPHVGGAG
ncbi:alpha/beta hydrolase fold [[Actinomadura] parvosata subsp. kistnae]|uniref:alpha/beta fold hydrolase n=1 Tax=[Actinomadura] parvosata TaxID=1955412 RepID=UPI000D26E8FD|nr:alpha/beta hydrolase [Nonomuraea sp. ATCC 55076]SPL90751.1 alpha/beta hydrolase fold [Actinomadura parvosata subsp. kistnae]